MKTTTPAATMLSENGRDGKIESDDKTFVVDFAPADGADGADGITPEHLFAGAYAACFHSALKSAAGKAHHDITGSTVVVTTRLVEQPDHGTALTVDLRASIPGVSASDAGRLLHQAHGSCPYSKAVRGNITVNLSLD
ncbi:MAG: Ohr family peroxiredoxin [Burkholderiales bacterium]|nr:Ohr family peroxiredoxin [Opitutaceae bacterium]